MADVAVHLQTIRRKRKEILNGTAHIFCTGRNDAPHFGSRKDSNACSYEQVSSQIGRQRFRKYDCLPQIIS